MNVAIEKTVARARAALQRSNVRELRHLTARDDGDHIGLHGRVDSYYHKQLAQELVRNELDGVEVVNHVEVAW